MSYSTQRIESVAPSIKRYDANLPTMICANRLAPAVLFSIGCAGLPAATHRGCDPCAAATSEISPSHSPTGCPGGVFRPGLADVPPFTLQLGIHIPSSLNFIQNQLPN